LCSPALTWWSTTTRRASQPAARGGADQAVWLAGAVEDSSPEIKGFSPSPYPDLALLKVDVSDHPCVYLFGGTRIDDRLYSFGYTDDYPSGDPATFRFEGETGEPVFGKL
jgi:hypothetical protein